MKRALLATVLAGLLVAVLTASTSAAAAVPTLAATGVSRAAPAPDAPVDALTRGITGLGYDLSRVSAPPGTNWVASPLSIAYAFAMARAGARGETAAQLDRVLGFPGTGTDAAFNALTGNLAENAAVPDGMQPPVVRIANGLFPQRDYPVQPAYLRTLAAQYGTGVHPLDFHSPTAAAAINAWVRQQTANRIQRLFDQLPGDTKLVLANAVYFKAGWLEPFGATSAPEPFTLAGGRRTSVPMMRQGSVLRYADGPDWQAVELPYVGDRFAMWVLVPAADTAPGALLAPASMARVAAGLQPGLVDLALPRWDFATDLDLTEQLGKLGLTVPFGAGADFSGIAPGLHIDRAVHRATITVDENGTEAAAVTGIAMATSARADKPVIVRADHPFAFAIVDRTTGVPLFEGQVADPSAH